MSARVERPGLYLHVPFCSAICPYCDFAVTVGPVAKQRRYVELLRRELALAADDLAGSEAFGEPFDTVYLGGGTPSLLGAELLAETLEAVGATLEVTPGARLSLEANPEDVDERSLDDWRALGVSFLSLGVQRFDDPGLAFLGRRHDSAQAARAVELALEAGFATVSVDLIYGLPDERAATWENNLRRAIALSPQHLSCYQLTVEPGTPFGRAHARGTLRPLDERRQAARFETTHATLAAAGYSGYEVSNFARGSAYRSGHNRKYWRHVPYLGVGPSAHSFDGRQRWWNERHLARWQRRLTAGERPVAGSETLDDDQLALEALMLGLRTADGIDVAAFRARYHRDPFADPAHVERLVADGFLRQDTPGHLRPTPRGLAVAEGLAAAWPLTSTAPCVFAS